MTYAFDDIGNRTQTGGRASAVSTYQPNELNQYTNRTVAGAIDVFGLADPQASVQVNGADASRYGAYFHRVVSVDNSASAQYPTLTIQAGNNSAARHAFVPKNPEIFSYDDDGNLTQDGRWTYEWNGENRLIRMTTRSDVPGPHYQLTFQYDWMGRRIRKTVVDADTGQTISDLIFLYDGWNLIAEVDTQTGELIRTYVWGLDLSGTFRGAGGIGGLLWVNVETGSHAGRYFAAYDGNGNVMGLVSASDGSVAAQYEYGPFAEPLRATGPLAAEIPIRFSGEYWDMQTGLIYYGYRYYHPNLGRWLSFDRIEDQRTGANYVMNHNAPVGRVDLYGLWGREVHYFATKKWALDLGYSERGAISIASYDEKTDYTFGLAPLPIPIAGNLSYHFNRNLSGEDSRIVHEREELGRAKRLCMKNVDRPEEASKHLGRALHAVQDWVAHGDYFTHIKSQGGISYFHNQYSPQEPKWGSVRTYPDNPMLDAIGTPDGRPAGNALHYRIIKKAEGNIYYHTVEIKVDYAIYEAGLKRYKLTRKKTIVDLDAFRAFLERQGGCRCKDWFLNGN